MAGPSLELLSLASVKTVLLAMAWARAAPSFLPSAGNRSFSTSNSLFQLRMGSRCRVVDNSAIGKQAMLEGRPPKLIQPCKNMDGHKFALIGDKIKVAIMGQMKFAVVIGCKQRQKPLVPRFDSNNIVLLENNGNPTGTRILAPFPHCLRSNPEFAKLVAIATKFV